MPFRVKDVLIVDATVIIGLLILLTFQSISSSFIESEIAAMDKELRNVEATFDASWLLLEDCEWLMSDRDDYEEAMVEWLVQEYDDGSRINFINSFTPEMEEAFLAKCTTTLVKINEDLFYYKSVQQQNFDKFYLSQYIDNEERNAIDGYFYDENFWETTEKSSYFETIVTGPYWVNIANVVMIIPFTISAIIASFNAFRKNEETNKASRISVFAMGIGFATMIVGFIIILSAIHFVYRPYF